MLTPIKKQGDEHIYILLQFDIIDWIPVCYVDIRRFVWMLIGSEITGNHQKSPEFTCGEALSIPRLLLRLGVGFRLLSLSSRKPAMISSTWRPFQECLENMRKSRNWWCGWFRGFFRYSSSDTSASTFSPFSYLESCFHNVQSYFHNVLRHLCLPGC